MTSESSIKWRPVWKLWIPFLLFLIPLILEHQLFGTMFTAYIYGLIVFAAGIIYYFRFKLWQSFALMTMMSIAICTYFLSSRPALIADMIRLLGIEPGHGLVPWVQQYLNLWVWFVILIINFIIFFSMGPVLLKALELEKSAIRLFKLAAREVSGVKNGFTGRPYQAGEHPYKRNQIIGLASFLELKKVCVAEFTQNGIRFIFSMGISPLNKSYRDKLSYVDFGEDGKLSVFISEQDYRQYREEYTFDQLCELMGKIFMRFAEYYLANYENRILTELRSV